MPTVDEVESKLSLTQLIQQVGFDLLRNPFLVAIIDAAPSPKAADVYMRIMCWPNELARRVRTGVRLRDRIKSENPDMWSELTHPDVRIAEQLFEFARSPLEFSGCTVLNDTALNVLGFKVHRDDMPLFLREFWVKSGNKCDITTVDSHAFVDNGYLNLNSERSPHFTGRPPWDSYPLSCFWSRNHHKTRFTGSINNKELLIVTVPQIETLERGLTFGLIGDGRDINLITNNAIVTRKEGFPQWFKQLEFRNEFAKPEGKTIEYVRVFIRQDLGPEIFDRSLDNMVEFSRGEAVFYERVVHVSENVHVVLRITFKISVRDRGSFHLFSGEPNSTPISMEFPQREKATASKHSFGLRYNHARVGRAMLELSKLLEQIQNAKNTISLERIAGLSLVQNPPAEFAQLFLEQEPSERR